MFPFHLYEEKATTKNVHFHTKPFHHYEKNEKRAHFHAKPFHHYEEKAHTKMYTFILSFFHYYEEKAHTKMYTFMLSLFFITTRMKQMLLSKCVHFYAKAFHHYDECEK